MRQLLNWFLNWIILSYLDLLKAEKIAREAYSEGFKDCWNNIKEWSKIKNDEREEIEKKDGIVAWFTTGTKINSINNDFAKLLALMVMIKKAIC